MTSAPEENDGLSFDGPHIMCGTVVQAVNWTKGKNVTLKPIRKRGRGTIRTVTKQVPNDTFFELLHPARGS